MRLVWALTGLMAATPALAQDVAVLGAARDVTIGSLVAEQLVCSGEFRTVTPIDVAASTPSLEDLTNYHAVFVWSEVPFADAVQLALVQT